MQYSRNYSSFEIHKSLMAYPYNTILSHNAEIRYFKIFQSLKDMFRSTYSCNKNHCPMLKDRWKHHMKTHHPEATTHTEGPSNMGPTPKRSKSSHTVLSDQTIYPSSSRHDQESKHLLKVLDTDLDDVRNAVIDLFKDFPHTDNYNTKQLKQTLINSLVDEINRLIKDGVSDEEQINTEIDNVINKELGNYPDKTNTMVSFVKGLSGELCQIVKSKQSKEKKRLSQSDNGSALAHLKTKSQILHDELNKILKDYPIHTNTQNSKKFKDKVIKDLENDIHGILNDKTIPASVKKTEIDNLLDKFNKKYPTSTNTELENIKSKVFDMVKGKKSASKTRKRSRSLSSTTSFRQNSDVTTTRKHSRPLNLSTSSRQNSDVTNQNTTKRVENEMNDNVTKDIENIFNDFPTLTQETENYNMEDEISKLSADLKQVFARNKEYNENAIKTEIDYLLYKLSGKLPEMKKDDKFKNDVKARLLKTIKDHYKDDAKPKFIDNKKRSFTYGNAGASGNFRASGSLGEGGNNSKDNKNPRSGISLNRSTAPYKDTKPAFNNYTKSNFTDGNVGTSSNFGPSGNLGKSGYYSENEMFPRAGINIGSMMSQSDSYLSTNQASIKKDFEKSELRQILESSVYPQMSDERKDSLINRVFYDIEGLKNRSRMKNDSEIKNELDKLIEKIPLWYPGAKREQLKYVNNLKDKLFGYIRDPTKVVTSTSYDKQRNIHDYRNRLSAIDDSVLTFFTHDNLAENLVRDWVGNIANDAYMYGVDKEDLVKTITDRIKPILQRNSCGKKIILKGAILETFSYIPATFKCNLKLQKLVNELVNDLNYMYRNQPNKCCQTNSRTMFLNIYRDFYKIYALRKANQCLDNTKMADNVTVREEIADLILHHSDNVSLDNEVELENDIIKTLIKNTDASERDILLTAKTITGCLCNSNTTEVETNTVFPAVKSIAVLTSFTNNSMKKVQRLNDEEIDYINRVSVLVRAWMDILPVQFNAPEEHGFKESMISELAGNFMDVHKVDQLVAFPPGGKDNNLEYHVYVWLSKFNCFDIQELKPSIDSFLAKLSEIPVPDLTKSYRGTRQMMDNIKHMEAKDGMKEHYVPRGIDVLEDEISIWVHEQPSDLFIFDNKTRNHKIHELATVVQPKLARKENENVISHDLRQWLNNNLKRDANLNELERNLKARVINLPQDATLRRNLEEKLQERQLAAEQYEKLNDQPPRAPVDDDTIILDKTMNDFISKFIEHDYDVDDPKTRAAFNHLLKRKLLRLTPQSRQTVYNQPNEIDFIVPPDTLVCELEYIKLISDWLKSIPVENNFNRPHNRERIDFILGLARTLSEVENERAKSPYDMDYDMYTGSLIATHLRVVPIPKQYKNTNIVDILTGYLLEKLGNTRETIRVKMAESIANESGINEENLGDFLEEFIKLHGNDIADDEVKMEVWTIRLIREIRNIVEQEGTEVSKAHVYRQMLTVPKPGSETIHGFDTELIYIKDITEWMKNLPFKHLSQEEEKNRTQMICDLAEYLAAKEIVTIKDKELAEYLTQWISELPLDSSHPFVVHILIEQLINRINNDYRDEQKHIDLAEQEWKRNIKASKSKLRGDPGTIVVDAVEKWSKSLPLNEGSNNEALQSNVAKKLYQKIGEFNSDPGIYNDDLLYETFLKDQIESIVEKLPNGYEVRVKNEKNNAKLLKTLVEANTFAKEMYAGERYKQKLEHTIDSSIPEPVTNRQSYDPAFEIYKIKLADMFILENFDHGNDQVKAKYERKIRNEIDRYFEGAQHKNRKRLTKDEIYNELYSNLFKVPIPNEISTTAEVEKVKTRQVIDEWFEELPLKESDDIIELLEWDKKLDSLTKSIHKIEKSSKSDEKILKEITKWLTSMPMTPYQVHRINEFAEKLKDKFKSTENERKCVSEKDAKSKKDKKSKPKSKSSRTSIYDPNQQQTLDLQVQGRAFKRNAADMIVDVVEQWCSELDLIVPESTSGANQDQVQNIRNELVRKIMIKISEIHMNAAVFDDDLLYRQTLDAELGKTLADVRTSCCFNTAELIESINAVKPLINDEKDKVNYMANLDNTVDKELRIDPETLASREDEFKALKDEIVENYVQLNYDQDDEEKQVYKQKIYDAVDKFLRNIKHAKDSNPLMKRNQLICELNKVPKPSDNVIMDAVDEIRMKEQVTEFLEENSLNNIKDKPVASIKTVLAKNLTAIESSGHPRENHDKMVKAIKRSLTKFGRKLDPNKIERFVQKLKLNEQERKRRYTLSSLSELKQIKNTQHCANSEAMPGCARQRSFVRFQECCPCDSKKTKTVCPRPYTKLYCDPSDDPFCYKMPQYCP